MRKRFRIILAVLIVAMVGGMAWQVVRLREPTYQGKRLSVWLKDFDSGDLPGSSTETAKALGQIGTNAIPILLHWLRAEDSAVTRKVLQVVGRNMLIADFIARHHTSAWERNEQAGSGFLFLGASAKGAVPALIKIHDQNISITSRTETAAALGAIGPAAAPAVPSLLKWMNTTKFTRSIYIKALGNIHADPAEVVPVLVNCLHPEMEEWREAALALGKFGAEAKPAVPALVALIGDNKSYPRVEVDDALKAIDPEAAAKAGMK